MDKIFGLAEPALNVAEQRATLISGNIVNSSTPGYKAKDIDFDAIMKDVDSQSRELKSTKQNHIHTGSAELGNLPILYRIPMQVSMDGNTVDPEIERKNFLENSMKYQVSLTFIHNKTNELIKAMKGE